MKHSRVSLFSSILGLIGVRQPLPRNPHLDLSRQMHKHAFDLARQIEALHKLSPEQRSALHATVVKISEWADRIAPEEVVEDYDLPSYEDGWFGPASRAQ